MKTFNLWLAAYKLVQDWRIYSVYIALQNMQTLENPGEKVFLNLWFLDNLELKLRARRPGHTNWNCAWAPNFLRQLSLPILLTWDVVPLLFWLVPADRKVHILKFCDQKSAK